MTTIGESISRVRNVIKATKQDAFITDRLIYSLILKYAKLYIKKQDAQNMRLKFSSLFKPVTIDLIEVDKTDSFCNPGMFNCKVMRSKDKLPIPLEGSYGAFIRYATSVDGYTEVYRTTLSAYTSMSKTTAFKYNKSKYYWYLGGYVYLPNVEWPSLRLEGIWEDNISVFACGPKAECSIRQNEAFPIPDDLFAVIESQVLQDLGFNLQIPQDPKLIDKQNILR